MLTIITSLYKSEKYVKKIADHLLAAGLILQKSIDFEFIVIANDPSEEENNAFKSLKDKEWFKYVSVPREPLYATWNRGVEMAQGNAIGFWNADDVRYSEALLDGVKLLEAGAGVVYFPFTIKRYFNLFGFSFLVKKRQIIPEVFDRKKFTTGMHCGPFFLFSKDFYHKVGPFDEQFRIGGDFDWCVRAAKISNKFSLSKENAGEFRVDGSGLSAGSKWRLKLENSVLFKRHSIPIKIDEVSDEEINKFKINQILHKGEYLSI